MSNNAIPLPIDGVNDLAKYMDERQDSPPRSPLIKPARETTESFVKSTKSNIPGWSPTRSGESAKTRRPSGNKHIDNFSLTPLASGDGSLAEDSSQTRILSDGKQVDKKNNKGKKRW